MSYQGPAVVQAGERRHPVQLRLAGHVEPVDGRFHWGGRIAPDPDIVSLAQRGQRAVTVQIGDQPASEARLGEPDPWGGIRVLGIGRPPWTVESV